MSLAGTTDGKGMMQKMKREYRGRAKAWNRPGLWILAVLAVTLVGCAAGTGRVDRDEQAGRPASVTRLKEGRQGFIIQETPTMDAAARRDFARGVALLQEKQYAEAIEVLEKVVAAEPGVTAPYLNLAQAYMALEKLEPAEKHLQKALGLVPDHPAVSIEYGLLLRKSGRFAEARSILEKTLARFPEFLPAHRNLGILCDFYLNDQKCALEQFETYIAAKPDDEQVKLWIAELKLRLGL